MTGPGDSWWAAIRAILKWMLIGVACVVGLIVSIWFLWLVGLALHIFHVE